MSDVTRYDQQFRISDSSLREYDDGRYVKHSDYARLYRQNQMLRATLRGLREALLDEGYTESADNIDDALTYDGEQIL